MTAEIFTKPTCPHCINAKKLLTNRGISYVEHTVGVNGVTKQTIEDKIGNGYEVKTVPQIFIDGEHVGGYTELAKKFGV